MFPASLFDELPASPSYGFNTPLDELDSNVNDEGSDDFYDDGYNDNDGYGHSREEFGDEDLYNDDDDSDEDDSSDDWSME